MSSGPREHGLWVRPKFRASPEVTVTFKGPVTRAALILDTFVGIAGFSGRAGWIIMEGLE